MSSGAEAKACDAMARMLSREQTPYQRQVESKYGAYFTGCFLQGIQREHGESGNAHRKAGSALQKQVQGYQNLD